MNHLLESISDIYVINLDHRSDRWDEFVARWEGILDFSRVHRVSAVLGKELAGFGEQPWFSERTAGREGTWAGVAGCTLSHRRVLQQARESTADYVLVLEDDATPSPWLSSVNTEADAQKFSEFLRTNTQWGICYLGYTFKPMVGVPMALSSGTTGGASEQPTWQLWRVPGVLCMHAAIIHRRSFDVIIDHLPSEETVWPWVARYRAIDTWLQRHFTTTSHYDVHIVAPQLVVQGDSVSDILNREVVYDHSDICKEPHAVSPSRFERMKIFPGILRRLSWVAIESYKFLRSRTGGFPGHH